MVGRCYWGGRIVDSLCMGVRKQLQYIYLSLHGRDVILMVVLVTFVYKVVVAVH